MSLKIYQEKRDFKQTSEPKGKVEEAGKFRFVIQRHQASRLHYDVRLELNGVLKSWAVPKGPSLNPKDKRLAVQTEDHPVAYLTFKGEIPKGNYGAGHMDIWDSGTFVPVDEKQKKILGAQALKNLSAGELKFELKGKKLKGGFVLVRLKADDKNWLLIKHKDEHSLSSYDAEKIKPEEDKNTIVSIRFGKGKELSEFIKPMLASPGGEISEENDFIYEIKWDGYRAIAEIRKGEIKLYSRNGLDFSGRFPAVFKALKEIGHDCILDGEIVLLNDKGLPDFQKLQHYETNLKYPLVYYVFDLLELNGKDTTVLPLLNRKELLKELLGKQDIIRYCDHVTGNGAAFLAKTKEQGIEGVIGKLKDSQYKPGIRSKEWLKFKNVQTAEVIIAGFTEPSGSRKHFGSLILAGKHGKGFVFKGHTGTGFSDQTLKAMMDIMKPLIREDSPFAKKVAVNGKPTWIEPELVAEIAFTEQTKDGLYRHPVFIGLRDDKDLETFNEESMIPQKPEPRSEVKVGRIKVPVTNITKIYFPGEGITKGEVIDYYNKVSSFILPHLKGRPLSLFRSPNGIAEQGFYHKDAGEQAPDFVDVFKHDSESSNKTIDYIVCNNNATLIYLANLGCIEMNPWNSTEKAPENPTWIVIDIDPSDKNSFEQVIETALVTKEICDKAGVKSYCKTSGATGLHIYIPLANKYDYEIARKFAHIIATLVQQQLPDFTTLERSLSKRGPKIYIDYLQNRGGQTLASAYSIRPKPGATVSTPLEWSEVKHGLKPTDFTIHNILKRLEKKGDLFKQVLTGKTSIEKAINKLGA